MGRICYKKYTLIIINLVLILEINCYEKTLRKLVRDQSKMVQRPFSDNYKGSTGRKTAHNFMSPGFSQVKSAVQIFQRPKVSSLLSTSDSTKVKSKGKIDKHTTVYPFEIRLTRNALTDMIQSNEKEHMLFQDFAIFDQNNINDSIKIAMETYYRIPQSTFFPSLDVEHLEANDENKNTNENPILIPEKIIMKDNASLLVKGIIDKKKLSKPNSISLKTELSNLLALDPENDTVDFIIENIGIKPNTSIYNSYSSVDLYDCTDLPEAKADIDAQELFSKLDIEPPWISKKTFWNSLFESRYESLVRSAKWPPLKVLLIPRTQVDSIWKQPFDHLFNNTVRKIISNIVKKLNFYKNLTFTWNEVSHFSVWWRTTNKKYRTAVRRLIKEKRFEITTGGWVETDEATSHIFGMLHQLMEGHQWLKNNLNYFPEVAWLTNSVTHSPTAPYILSASGISKLIITNLHYSFEQYLAEYQYSDFIWIQNWDTNCKEETKLNNDLDKIGNDRYPVHSVIAHYLQFNSASFDACGPDKEICLKEFDFDRTNKNLNINTYNVKDKSETLLEQYSKTGTLSSHNIIIAPIGGSYNYEDQKTFDYQFNNYWKMADFVNKNQDIYKATLEFGTPKKYFNSIINIHKNYPKIKGDFTNFADIKSGTPAYWTGFFTTRPSHKILLRHLQSNLRSAEILFSFALSLKVFGTFNMIDLHELLLKTRQTVARLQDRHVVSGTLTARAMKYVHSEILTATKDCWYIQEAAASVLSNKREFNNKYLVKYIYREGDLFFKFKSIIPGDQIYVFNSLSQERTEVIELTSRFHNVRIVDHNKNYVTTQINPLWRVNSDNIIIISREFYKISFIITLPPFTLALFQIKETFDASQTASTIYCVDCSAENASDSTNLPFDIQSIKPGDIQIENYKYRLLIDENTGFLRSVVDKTTGNDKNIIIDYGAFRSSNKNSGMFLFKTNASRPLYDILLPFHKGIKKKLMIIISGQITTEVTSIFGKLLQHTIKIYNTMHTHLKDVLTIDSKIDYDYSPKNRELEMFLSLESDVKNGETPEVFVDNNNFQYTSHIVNISRPLESNLLPMTSTAYIQDKKLRLTVLTDHAQGITALQEGQLVLILDRRVLYNDNRGTGEGIADSSVTFHKHILLLENFNVLERDAHDTLPKSYIKLPSLSAIFFANVLSYPLDVYFISRDDSHLNYYSFLPLVKVYFPCDVFVINYRVTLDKGFPAAHATNTALITLQRQTFSCHINFAPSTKCHRESHFNIISIFRNIREVYRTNLVGTNDGVPAKIFNLSNFKPMELMTVRVYF